MVYTSSRRNNVRKVITKDNKMRLINNLSRFKSDLSNYFKSSNIYSVEIIITCDSSTLEYFSSSNSMFNSPMIIDMDSSICRNELI